MRIEKQFVLSWTTILLIAVLTAAVAVNSQTSTLARSTPMSSEQNKNVEQANQKIIRSNFDKISRGDINGAAEDFSEDISNHGEKVGRDGIRMVLEDIVRTFPDVKLEIKSMVAEGDTVVVRASFYGTHKGVGKFPVNGGFLIGVEPTGKSFSVQHIHWFRLRDQKIVEHYASRDDIEMMQQLGLPLQVTSGPRSGAADR
jgi:predicted ester cyclase